MRARAETHGDDIELSHLIEDGLRGALAVLLAQAALRNNDLLDELAVRKLEFEMML